MSHEVKCPQCKTAFKIDESGYADIVKQVRDDLYEREISERIGFVESSLESKFQLERAQVLTEAKDAAVQKDRRIDELNGIIALGETRQELSVRTAVEPLRSDLADVKARLAQSETSKELAVRSATDPLKGQIRIAEIEAQRLQREYESGINALKQEHQAYLDMRTALSTKMLGESLEDHCRQEFTKNQSHGLFPSATFERDTIGDSQGDFIFRDFVDGVEILSIMFEMKNQDEATQRKQKNSQHFEKLDRDRNRKGCEYAVLVSLLETDSDLYNSGIVDASHEFGKMYVVRPQCFTPIITLLRNAALRSAGDRKELIRAQEQNIDVTNFVDKLQAFKESFSRNYNIASGHFEEAIKQIDKSIKSLEATKEKLMRSSNQLRIANDKAEDVTIRKLTHDNPTMQEAFKDIES